MFGDAMLTDLKPSEFWKLTIREWFIYSECFHKKRKEQMDYDISLAWYTAYFHRVNKLPALNSIIKKEMKAQSPDEIFNKMKAINAMLGGEVR